MPSLVGLRPCGSLYWAIYAVFAVICIGLAVFGIIYARYTYRAKKLCGYQFIKGDIRWSWKQTSVMTSYTSVGVMIATFVGIGPGVMISPMLLHLGFDAFSVAATSAYNS